MELFNPNTTAKEASRNGYGYHYNKYQPFGASVGQALNTWSGKTAEMQLGEEYAQNQREWEQFMSDTAHQREVEDLHAAGLNPASMDGGAGASTPNGAAAPGHGSPSGSGLLAFLGGLARSAIGAVMTKKMIEAGAGDHAEYRKMMGEYYSAKNALMDQKNRIAVAHERKNRGFNMAYSNWKG